jgi:hypothetical protein
MTLQASLAILLRDMSDLLDPHFEEIPEVTENENARPPNLDVTVKTGGAEPTQLARDCVDIIALRMECDVEWVPMDEGQWALVFTAKEPS